MSSTSSTPLEKEKQNNKKLSQIEKLSKLEHIYLFWFLTSWIIIAQAAKNTRHLIDQIKKYHFFNIDGPFEVDISVDSF